jgi:HAD superfamily hydrolase (TIGR01549 family)
MIKAIIFDLWNTLAYNDTPENPMIHLLMMQKFPSVLDAAKQICEIFGIEPANDLIRDMLDIWDLSKIHFSFFPDVVPVLQKLKEKYRLGLVSNTDCFTIKPFFTEGYKQYFDVLAFSYELGILKPDRKIFELVLDGLQAKPEETLMVGDNLQDDVLAAEKLGMQAVLIKRDPAEFSFVPSWVESGTHAKTIKNLKELEGFL